MLTTRVREIVLTAVGSNPHDSAAYLTDPAMRLSVGVMTKVLERAAEVLTTTGGHSPEHAEHLIREIISACLTSDRDAQLALAALAAGPPAPLDGIR